MIFARNRHFFHGFFSMIPWIIWAKVPTGVQRWHAERCHCQCCAPSLWPPSSYGFWWYSGDSIWVWINTYYCNTIFNGMNIHLPAILMFTRGTRFWHTAIWIWYGLRMILIQMGIGISRNMSTWDETLEVLSPLSEPYPFAVQPRLVVWPTIWHSSWSWSLLSL